jgi:hypothetical protein
MTVTKTDPKFREHMGGFFHDLLRAGGVSMPATNSLDRIRTIGEKMADTIEHAAERKSIQVVERLQIAVVDAFNQVEAKLQAHKEAKQAMMKLIKTQNEQLQFLRERTVALGAQAVELAGGIEALQAQQVADACDHRERIEKLDARVKELGELQSGDCVLFRNQIKLLDSRANRLAVFVGAKEDNFAMTTEPAGPGEKGGPINEREHEEAMKAKADEE